MDGWMDGDTVLQNHNTSETEKEANKTNKTDKTNKGKKQI